MNSQQVADINDSLDEIIIDYEEKGVLDVNSANEFIDKITNLSVDENDIRYVAQTFVNIYNGNHHIQLDDDRPAESVQARLFAGIQGMLSKALSGLGKNSAMTTTQSVKSNLRIEIQENGTKVLIWDFIRTKTTTPTGKVSYFLITFLWATVSQSSYISQSDVIHFYISIFL